MSVNSETGYTAEYYESHLGGDDYIHNQAFVELNRNFAQQICEKIAPNTVLDVGCACGHLVSALREKGVAAFGVDSSEYALKNVQKQNREFCILSVLPELKIPANFPAHFDLVTCIEVLEHIPEEFASASIHALTQFADRILFSSTPSDFDEVTHINVRPRSYWAQLFANEGFYPDWTVDASFISPQAIFFCKKKQPRNAFVFLDFEYTRTNAIAQERDEQLRNNLILLEENKKITAEKERQQKDNLALREASDKIAKERDEQFRNNLILLEENKKIATEKEQLYKNNLLLLNSYSWKITQPLRYIHAQLINIKNIRKKTK